MAETTLWLDSYDDIYSDFDSRNYRKRRISEDFLDELKAALKYEGKPIETLMLRLPGSQRDKSVEAEIVSSIRKQIADRQNVLKANSAKWRKRGLLFAVCGLLAMLINSLIAYKFDKGLTPILVRVVLEPAGWFLIWTGLDFLLFEYRKFGKDHSFHQMAVELNIEFQDSKEA